MEEPTPVNAAAKPGRRRAIAGFLVGLTGIVLSRGDTTEAKKKRKKIRRKARRRCKPDNATPIEPGADPPCDICPQRYCCYCGSLCFYPSSVDQDPALVCDNVCNGEGHGVAKSVPPEAGRANFCTVDNTCAVIECPVG